MNIKSYQTLVEEAQKSIETLSSDEAKKLAENKEITLIDVRDIGCVDTVLSLQPVVVSSSLIQNKLFVANYSSMR